MYVVNEHGGKIVARKTREEAQKTREAILDTAVSIFSEKGVSRTSLAEIANAAQVTRGAIYWHFDNKAEIFDALHNRLYQPVNEMILQDLEKDYGHPLQQIEALCVRFLEDLAENTKKQQALRLFLVKCDYSGELAAYAQQHAMRKRENFEMFSRYFEKGVEQGLLPEDADTHIMALSLSCYIKGIVLEYLDNPDDFQLGEMAPQLIHCFFGGVERHK